MWGGENSAIIKTKKPSNNVLYSSQSLQSTQRINEADLSLNQQVTLTSDVKRKARDVDSAPVGNLTNHAVNQNVCARPTHTSTESTRKESGEV